MHATLADVITDTAQNSIEAGAHHITLTLREDNDFLHVHISDDGKGMDTGTLARAFNPFFTEPGKHDKRRVGLGLPILKQLCEATGGDVSLTSKPGCGTELDYRFQAGHIDLPPMGDLAAALVTLFNYPGDYEFTFTHVRNGRDYSIARSELNEAVGGLETVEGLSLAKQFLASQEEDLRNPTEDEGEVA